MTEAAADSAADSAPVLTVRDLRISFPGGESRVDAVRGVDLELRRGEVLALVGESGSGKSVTALAAMGLLPPDAQVAGRLLVGDRDVTRLGPAELRDMRGREIGMVFQEPTTALNPVLTVGDQIGEALTNHENLTAAQVRERTLELLEAVGIPEAAERMRAYPHQLSGGLCQRVVIAMAVACNPAVIIADEPTTALDVTVQAQIMRLLRELRDSRGTAILLITHNMGVVADLADRVAVMRDGVVVEVGTAEQVLTDPQHEYTTALLAAVPRLGSGSRAAATDEPAADRPPTVLDLQEVRVEYRTLGRPAVRAVGDVTLAVRRGEVVGLVGESGSGKSTIGRCALGLVPATAGHVTLLGVDQRRLRGSRGRRVRRGVGVVLQNPASALDPRMTVGDSVAEPMVIHRVGSRAERQQRVRRLLDDVRLPAAAADRYPHEMSGGQRQRVGLARALSLEPDLVIADEPTSALDVSVQETVLRLLTELQAVHGFGCLFISHDLAVVESVAHRVVVLLGGRIVEEGATQDVLHRPREDYTRLLISSVPVPDPVQQAARRAAADAVLRESARALAG
ncbi:dipeptide ABC transporter ATP-binding protein [Pseudonocardia xinjiangensis]|uniref:dipeptide ABC transporter ATP-binding protein n=1 Tax=Pseudonocardia xinjiangensis TaxID=75289 RepID=UPI003D91053E